MDEQIALFMDITSVSDPAVASNFMEMAGGNLDSAVGLYFEHGAGAAASTTSQTADDSNAIQTEQNHGDDFELANRLQREMYEQQDQVRQPIMPTHDTLLPQEYGFGGMNGLGFGTHPGMNTAPQGGMFGRAQTSVFNQTNNDNVLILDSDDDEDDDDNDVYNNYNDGITGNYGLDSGTRLQIGQKKNKMSSTQKRLANIFRPPWDIISKVDLDTAKKIGREEKKWILVNIQDVTDFRCQCLNRDFWSSQQIKQIVEHNFIFLQYHHDSPSGELYRNLYPFNEEYPHIAILDPMTGERMLTWNSNPGIDKFIEQVMDFLDRFTLDGTSAKIAPTSVGMNKQYAIPVDESEKEEEEEEEEDEEVSELPLQDEETPRVLTYAEKIHEIVAQDIPDPPSDTDPSLTTRIQIRSGIDGKRVVKKFLLTDTLVKLFQFAKFSFQDSLQDRAFTLKMQRTNLGDCLDKSVAECQLQNASLLLEVVDDEDDE